MEPENKKTQYNDLVEEGNAPAEQPETKVKKNERDEEVAELLTDSGIGALAKAAAANTKKVKVFWVLLFLCAVIGFSSNLYHIIYRFFRVPVLTQMDQEFGNFTWPHLTFCNPSNPIPFWKSKDLVKKWDRLLKKKLPKMVYEGRKGVTIFPQYYLMSSVAPHEFYKESSNSLILSVQVLYQDRRLLTSSGDFDRYRGVRNFKMALDDRLGSSRYPLPCLTVRPETIAELSEGIKDPSELIAIKFTLIMDFKSYNIFNSGFENRKLYMFLSRPNETLKSSTLYFIYPGTDSTFIVTENRYKRIRGCDDTRFKVKMYDSTMTSTKTYTGGFESCIEYVSQQVYYEKCKCYNPFLPIYKVSNALPRLCLNISLYDSSKLQENLQCLNNVSQNAFFEKKFQEKIADACTRYKTPLCYQSTYSYIRNTNTWNSQMSESRRMRMRGAVTNLPNTVTNATEDFVNLNVAMVKLTRAPGLVTATLEEFEYPASQLLSDIGGTMGLWLGISVISLFEILQFVILLTQLSVRRSRLARAKEARK